MEEILDSIDNSYVRELLQTWIEANDAYYNTDEPILSDESYDNLTEELLKLSDEYPKISSIIEKQISTIDGMKNVDEVISQMISLKKIKWSGLTTINEIFKFLNPKRQQLNLFYGIKLDGMAIKVSKQNGITKILTRGGQDVTDMLINHPDIITITRPITHGELVIKKSVFKEKYSDEYENPRNCILGVLKQNPNDLDFIECTDGISPLTNILTTNVWFEYKNQDLSKIYYELKQNYQYQIDGIVIGFKTDKQQIKDNYPMNIVAVKFKAESVKSKVVNFNWTQKKSGNLTPIIEVEPVKLDGSTITYVSGYNYSNLKKLHIGIGSEILITKSGDIIPVVEKVITRSDKINMPTCEYIISGKHLIASDNENSEIYKFILGLKLLNIDGIGPTIADKIGKVVNYNIIELFNNVNKPKIIQVLGSGAVWNKFENFYQIKNIGLDLLIEILQFDRCGKTLSKRFAEIILKQSSDVSGIDKQVLNNVCRGEGFKKIQNSMEILKNYGIKVTKPITINDETISFEMSGTPPNNLSKLEFVKKLKNIYPNSIHTSLTKDTKFLIVDNINSSSGKINKARKYNIKIVTYQDALSGKI